VLKLQQHILRWDSKQDSSNKSSNSGNNSYLGDNVG
jgi:hypothetical protein